MGNRECSLASRQSTLSDISTSSHYSPPATSCPHSGHSVSRSSSESDEHSSGTSHNKSSFSSSAPPLHKTSIRSMTGCPDLEVLQVAAHTMAPMKQRKVSRAASASRIRHRNSFRNVPGLSGLTTRTDVMKDGLKECVQDTWAVVQSTVPSSILIGCGIYHRIFESAPELRTVFRIPEDVTDIALFEPFHRSAKLFVSLIDLCVRNIYTLESEMGPVLVMYGRRHYHYLYEAQYGGNDAAFRERHLPLFTDSILHFLFSVLPPEDRNASVQSGWRTLLTYITSKIVEGYDLERQRNANLRRKSVL